MRRRYDYKIKVLDYFERALEVQTVSSSKKARIMAQFLRQKHNFPGASIRIIMEKSVRRALWCGFMTRERASHEI